VYIVDNQKNNMQHFQADIQYW